MRSVRALIFARICRRSARHLSIALTLSGVALVSPVRSAAAPGDASANDVADKVMDPDKLYSNFLVAEKRLAAALKKCGRSACSRGVQARLYRDLGVVYIVGLRRLDQGKALLQKAVKADPAIELDQRVATPELEQLFTEVGGGLKSRVADHLASKRNEEPPAEPEPRPQREDESESSEDEAGDEEPPVSSNDSSSASADDGELEADESATADAADTEPDGEAEEPKAPAKARSKKKTFLSLGVQQDFLYLPGDTGVCDADVEIYDCFDPRGSEYEAQIFDGAGNEVQSGLALSTTRLLVGYERQVGGSALVGVRLGYAFGGGPTPRTGSAFLPWHAELRGAYFFGSRPFERRSLRPNLSLGMGLAEMTSRVAVDYWESEQSHADGAEAGTLDSWRRSGKFFIAPGFGTMIPLGSRGALTVDLRAMLLFGKSATGMALGLGYALGI